MKRILDRGLEALRPTALVIEVGEVAGPKERISAEAGVVMWEHQDHGGVITARRVMPTDAEWALFWTQLETADFWRWDEYYADGPHNGYEWKVQVTFPGFSRTSSGCNAYPGQPRSEAWQVFWREVCLLAQPPTAA